MPGGTCLWRPCSPGRSSCSSTQAWPCTYLDDAETWPHLLMVDLNRGGQRTWVGAIGISGYSTVHHLDFLRVAPRLPVDAAIFLIGVNDFIRALNDRLELGPRPLWRHSALLATALEAGKRATLRHILYEKEDETGANLEARRRVRRHGGRRDELPDLDLALREYGERIDGLAGECRLLLRCLFLTQPVVWRQDLAGRALGSLWIEETAAGRFRPACCARGWTATTPPSSPAAHTWASSASISRRR